MVPAVTEAMAKTLTSNGSSAICKVEVSRAVSRGRIATLNPANPITTPSRWEPVRRSPTMIGATIAVSSGCRAAMSPETEDGTPWEIAHQTPPR